MKHIARAILAAAFALLAQSAVAATVTYTIEGSGTFYIGATAYSGNFLIDATGDTTEIASTPGGQMQAVSATLSVGDGALVTELSQPLWMTSAGGIVTLAYLPGAGFPGFIALSSIDLSDYVLGDRVGPSDSALIFAGGFFSTAAGTVSVGALDRGLTFTAAPVPLPATAGTLLLGLAVLGVLRRRRAAA